MADELEIRAIEAGEIRGVNKAAALAREQLKYALQIAGEFSPPGENPDATVVAGLLQAIATNYAAVK
jgi:hypothetical protein